MSEIKITEDKFLWNGHFFVDDVALIFGKSGSGKSTILKQLLRSNSKLSGHEKRYGNDAYKFYWFFSESKLFRWIEKSDLQPEFIKNWDDGDDGNAEKMLNEKINSVLVEAKFGFTINIEIEKYSEIKRMSGIAKGIKIDYLVEGDKVPPNNLSNGQKLCAAIFIHSFLLMGEGQIMLMDEPFNGIHHSMRKRILTWMKTLGKKFIIATHNIDLISQDTLLNVRYVEKVGGKGKIHNSFNFSEETGNSLFQQFGTIINRIGGEDEHEKWSPKSAFIVEGVSDFIYFMKNPILNKFLGDNKLRIVIAGGKDKIINILDKLNGNSDNVYILWDNDDDIRWNEDFVKEVTAREEFNNSHGIATSIKCVNTNEVIKGAIDIEEMLFDRCINGEEGEKAKYAFFNAINVKDEISMKVAKRLSNEFCIHNNLQLHL